jgi:hypothetical protein
MKTKKSSLNVIASRSLALLTLFALFGQPSPARAVTSRAATATMESRSAFATGIEGELRRDGVDARVQLIGDRRDTLRIEWQGMNQREVFHFVRSGAFNRDTEALGFQSIMFTDGTQQWDYDLARESMVWNSSPER